jgi:trk system potassium uptake protein TrkA
MRRCAVIGLGRYGMKLARALAAAGVEVIAIDRTAALVDEVRDDVTLAVRLDATDADVLKLHGVHEVEVAVVGIGQHFEAAALTVAVLSQIEVPRIIARARNEVQARILTSVGAHDTAMPEYESALRWAHRLTLPDLQQYFELDEDHSLIYRAAPESFHYKTPIELELRREFSVNLVAIKRGTASQEASGEAEGDVKSEAKESKSAEGSKPKQGPTIVPTANTSILPGDILVLVGTNDALSALPEE